VALRAGDDVELIARDMHSSFQKGLVTVRACFEVLSCILRYYEADEAGLSMIKTLNIVGNRSTKGLGKLMEMLKERNDKWLDEDGRRFICNLGFDTLQNEFQPSESHVS
jgi:hypothetical protein